MDCLILKYTYEPNGGLAEAYLYLTPVQTKAYLSYPSKYAQLSIDYVTCISDTGTCNAEYASSVSVTDSHDLRRFISNSDLCRSFEYIAITDPNLHEEFVAEELETTQDIKDKISDNHMYKFPWKFFTEGPADWVLKMRREAFPEYSSRNM